MGCKMSKRMSRKDKSKTSKKDLEKSTSTLESNSMIPTVEELQTMKRSELQKLCKQLGFKANGKNAELVERLQKHINDRNLMQKLGNNNNSQTDDNIKKTLSPVSTSPNAKESEENVTNLTFDVTDSTISTEEHIHISSVSLHPVSQIRSELQTNSSSHNKIPGSLTEISGQNQENFTDFLAKTAQSDSTKQNTNTCTRYCVVEGILKQNNKLSWRRIYLVGGRPVVSNRFGKCVAFVLEPCGVPAPDNYDDNFICGNCVKNNESYLKVQAALRGVTSNASLMVQEGLDLETCGATCRTPLSSDQIVNTSFSRNGSVKRKRSEDRNAVNTSGLSEKKQRQDPVTSRRSGTPASPQVRRARGEQLNLPRNIHNPWRPKKSTKTVGRVKEDVDFAKRVEEIIKNTMPGSEEEMSMIMASKSGRVQRSPTKTAA